MSDLYVAIDIGATWLRLAIAYEHGGFIEKTKQKTPMDGQELIENIVVGIENLLRGEDRGKLKAIGIGSMGPVNVAEGAIVNPPNIPLGKVNIAKPLHEEFDTPVYLVNDCTAGVLGEKYFGLGVGKENIVYITLSTGIGGGAIVDDHLLFGKDGNALEIGHFTVDPESKLACGCGRFGHWEGYASGSNIPRYVKYLYETGQLKGFDNSKLAIVTDGDVDKLRPEHIFDAAREGDRFALEIVERLAKVNAIGLENTIYAFDPELITIGGGIALNNPELVFNKMIEKLENITYIRLPEIKLTPLRDEAVLYGALALAKHPHHIPEKFRRYE